MSGNQSYMGGGQGSANMDRLPSSTASVYNAMGFYRPQGFNGTGTPTPGSWSNPGGPSNMMALNPGGLPQGFGRPRGPVDTMIGGPNMIGPGGLGGGLGSAVGLGGQGGGPGQYGGMGRQQLNNWIGSMYNPRNLLYNQNLTNQMTNSANPMEFPGWPPAVGLGPDGRPRNAPGFGGFGRGLEGRTPPFNPDRPGPAGPPIYYPPGGPGPQQLDIGQGHPALPPGMLPGEMTLQGAATRAGGGPGKRNLGQVGLGADSGYLPIRGRTKGVRR